MQFEIDSPVKAVQIHKGLYMFIVLLVRSIYLFVGVWIFFYLKDYCLFNPDSNLVVTIYMAVVSLACFQALGMPVSRLINVDLLKP